MESRIPGVKIVSLKKWEDQRGWLCEIFRRDEITTEIFPAMTYISVTHPGVARGPHAHHTQTDLFAFVGPSTFKMYVWDDRPDSLTYGLTENYLVGQDAPTVVIVPPGVVHAYKNIGEVDGLVVNCPNKLYAGEGKKEPVDEIRHENDPNSKFQLI
jgi:dTDP-4-dehydrorhamnose 3,5-epimerase